MCRRKNVQRRNKISFKQCILIIIKCVIIFIIFIKVIIFKILPFCYGYEQFREMMKNKNILLISEASKEFMRGLDLTMLGTVQQQYSFYILFLTQTFLKTVLGNPNTEDE